MKDIIKYGENLPRAEKVAVAVGRKEQIARKI
jgi:hypothetical protein